MSFLKLHKRKRCFLTSWQGTKVHTTNLGEKLRGNTGKNVP
jgi:hypothetical protein